MKKIFKHLQYALLLSLVILNSTTGNATTITDDAGQNLTINYVPKKVVSLSPSATENICAIGASKNLVGITYHDTYFEGLIGIPVIGGQFTPNFDLINAKNPDLLIVSPYNLEKAKIGRGDRKYPILVWDDNSSLSDANIKSDWLGALFNKKDELNKIKKYNQDLLDTITRKVGKISPDKHKRTLRVVAIHDSLYTPGQSSFQTEITRIASGTSPNFGPGNELVPISLNNWKNYNPQFLYACSDDKKTIESYIKKPGWSNVEAVKKHKISFFPCALTDRAAAHTGYFAAWLSATIYTDEFGQSDNFVYPHEILNKRLIKLNMPFVTEAKIVNYRIFDFVHKTLLIDFKSPQTIISTSDGQRDGIKTIGNSSSPPMVWGINHQGGWEEARLAHYKVLKLNEANSSLVYTGADMDNLSIKSSSFKDISITALITAGAESNAIRTSKDSGAYYKPGTINIIILSNRKLSPAGAARAMITITEAKTAALWDMDIRSSQSPKINPATGTGTDSIIVVAGGNGEAIDYTGGHAKIGELIAQTVYQGVQEALRKQNGKAPQRRIFDRLNERDVDIHGLLGTDPENYKKYPNFQSDLEALLLTPEYQGFIEAAFSLDDAYTMGQIIDDKAFETWAKSMASKISGRHVDKINQYVCDEETQLFLGKALNALATGLTTK